MEPQGQGRYDRQVRFAPIGPEGQRKLQTSRIAIVGMGALGTVLSTQLVRAGIGFVRLIDRDIIEPTNLQRQALYDELDAQLGRPKAEAAAERLQAANSEVLIEPVITDVSWRNAESLLQDVDVIVDGSDNYEIRYLMNDVAVKHGIAWAYGGAVSSYGTTAFFRPGMTPCLHCVFGPNPGGQQDTCDTVGVIAPIVSVIASFQVTETLKFLTGNLDALSNQIFYADLWKNQFNSVPLPPSALTCPCCAGRVFDSLTPRSEALTVSFCGRQTIQIKPEVASPLALEAIATRLSSLGQVRATQNVIQFVTGEAQLTVFRDGRALVHGVDDPGVARSLYARYIGM
jgi:molybdopterin/thiamine biosynthesis adenylyltransferase